MGTAKRIARVIIRIISIAGPAILLAAVLAGFAGVRYLCVLSPSMEPELPVGSLIVVVPARAENLKVGRNVTYRLGSNFVTHRIVEINKTEETLITQGLANSLPDAPVDFEAVAGVPVLCVPKLGRLTARFSGIAGKIILLSAGLLAVTAVLAADLLLSPGKTRKHNIESDCPGSWK